jgi:hypothetical protein
MLPFIVTYLDASYNHDINLYVFIIMNRSTMICLYDAQHMIKLIEVDYTLLLKSKEAVPSVSLICEHQNRYYMMYLRCTRWIIG